MGKAVEEVEEGEHRKVGQPKQKETKMMKINREYTKEHLRWCSGIPCRSRGTCPESCRGTVCVQRTGTLQSMVEIQWNEKEIKQAMNIVKCQLFIKALHPYILVYYLVGLLLVDLDSHVTLGSSKGESVTLLDSSFSIETTAYRLKLGMSYQFHGNWNLLGKRTRKTDVMTDI